jgi:hypothetical protein
VYSKHQGSTARGRLHEALSPDYFRPDERNIADFLKYIHQLARSIQYYNDNNQADGHWEDFLLSDECFILADIAAFRLNAFDQQRAFLSQSFDKYASLNDKVSVIGQLFDLCFDLCFQVNNWYHQASRFHKKRSSSHIEDELSAVIELKLHAVLRSLYQLEQHLLAQDWHGSVYHDFTKFQAIWKIHTFDEGSISTLASANTPEDALKNLLLIYRTVYITLSGLIARAPDMLRDSLENNNRHEPHIGLLLAFLEVYQYLQHDLNQLTQRHLDYYYHQILGQALSPRQPDQLFAVFSLAPDIRQLTLPQGTRLLAGQNPDGHNRYYRLQQDFTLSQAHISAIKTLFVSRDPNVDQYATYRFISGIYASHNADSLFGNDNPLDTWHTGWPSLGEEQRYLTPSERTMGDAQIGFAISSPTLLLGSGLRDVNICLIIAPDTMALLMRLLLDIAVRKSSSTDDIFFNIFSKTLSLAYSGPQGWVSIKDYDIFPPSESQANQINIRFSLSPSDPPIAPYLETTHQAGYPIQLPVITVTLQGLDSNHPYSFLEGLRLEEIRVQAKVRGLRNLVAYNQYGPLDLLQPMELFGPNPRQGAHFLIGHEELFCKPLNTLEIGWQYDPLPLDTGGFKAYYKAYNRNIDTNSFSAKLSARNEFRYWPLEERSRQEFELFKEAIDGSWVKSRILNNIDISRLQIKPSPGFITPLGQSSPAELPTGFLKLELHNPPMGFGFDIFPKIFAEAVAQQAARKGKSDASDIPNTPLVPRIQELQVNYTATSALVFDPRRAPENDPGAGDTFLHILPFGVKTIFHQGKASDNALLPILMNEGNLYIGIQNLILPQTINILFELTRSGNWQFGQTLFLQWDYLSFDEWKPFPPEAILEDGTKGLIETGILSLELREDMTANNQTLPAGHYWIRASIPEKAELLSRIVRIHAHAAAAINTMETPEEDNFTGVPAHTITGLEEPVPGIVSVVQPYDSFGGTPTETRPAFYNRISELLRHKRRCITRWDFERICLEHFPWLSQVKCIGPFEQPDLLQGSEVHMVAIPRVEQTDKFYEPKLSPGEIKQIEQYLGQFCSPFVRLVVRNPSYEYIRIKCKIRLLAPNPGLALRQLHHDILHFLCPWFFSRDKQASLGGTIKRSDLIAFLHTLPYVAYITGISVVQFQTDANGRYSIRDSALQDDTDDLIKGGTPWSVLAPSQYHDFTLIDTDEYALPEPTAFSDLKIGYNLFVPGDTPSIRQTTSAGNTPTTTPESPHEFTLFL